MVKKLYSKDSILEAFDSSLYSFYYRGFLFTYCTDSSYYAEVPSIGKRLFCNLIDGNITFTLVLMVHSTSGYLEYVHFTLTKRHLIFLSLVNRCSLSCDDILYFFLKNQCRGSKK